MATKLRGLIQGAGFASQCHTEALRYSGVEIVGMVSRNPEIVGKIAGEMNIPYAGTDWNKALAELKRHVEANSEYVGLEFAREARAMHEGETPERSIYGEARADEAKKLLEDGIPVAPLPFRPGRKSN